MFRPLCMALVFLALAGVGAASAAERKETVRVDWVPGVVFVAQRTTPAGVTVRPDLQVLKADGSPRTYLTQPGQAPVPWKLGLPVFQGDRLKLTVLVATGGAPLQTLLVRLDNKPLPLPPAAPWAVTIDTGGLTRDVHFIEAWALCAGSSPFAKDRSSDSTLAFEVVAPPASGDDGGSGTVIDPALVGGEAGPVTAPTPAQLLNASPTLRGKTPAPKASVALHLRRLIDSLDSLGPVGHTLKVSGPVNVSIDKTPGTTATRYWYAIVRGGAVEVFPGVLLDVQTARLQFFPYSSDPKSPRYGKGLHPGALMLYVWGVDKDGHPGSPVVTQLEIAG